MTVYERVMALGEWDLQLRVDTPKSVRDFIEPLSHIVILSGEIYANRVSDAAILSAALYTGVVLEVPGRELTISGHGLAWWLGDSDNQGAILTSLMTSPAASLSTWISAVLTPSALTVGTVTSPGGTTPGSYAWVTRRQALDGIVAGFGVEWRIKPNFTLDAATPANLYGSTPTTIAQRRSSSSGPASGTLVGLDAEIMARTSYDEYASTVYVSSQGGIGGAGGAAQFRDAQGNFPTIVRMVDSSNTPPGTEVAVATTLVNQYGNVAGNRTVTVDVRRYGLTRILKAGSYLYLYDPEFGLYSVGGSPLRHDGSAVFPATTRVLGVRWPIERGMGVLVRYWDNATAAFRYADLTPYVEFEDGTASLEVV